MRGPILSLTSVTVHAPMVSQLLFPSGAGIGGEFVLRSYTVFVNAEAVLKFASLLEKINHQSQQTQCSFLLEKQAPEQEQVFHPETLVPGESQREHNQEFLFPETRWNIAAWV